MDLDSTMSSAAGSDGTISNSGRVAMAVDLAVAAAVAEPALDWRTLMGNWSVEIVTATSTDDRHDRSNRHE